MNVLSLFTGIGGLDLGLERAGHTTIGQVEQNPYCNQILKKHWPDVPKHDDVRTAGTWWQTQPRPPVHAIAGGFPCQDLSVAGKGEGLNGERSGLWFAMRDTISMVRPRYVIVENVAALTNRGLDVVLGDLADLGFDAEWSIVSACSVGAPHTRKRLFLLAYDRCHRLERRAANPQEGRGTQAIDSARQGRMLTWGAVPEPETWGVAHGFPDRVDRTRSLGNAVVPQVAELIGRRLMEIDKYSPEC